MKKITISALVMTALFFAACKKERTCSCTNTQTTTTTTVPQNGSASSQSSSSGVSKSEQTVSGIKKSEMRRFAGCLSSSETSTDTHPMTVYVGSPVPQPVTADVTQTTVSDKVCEIK